MDSAVWSKPWVVDCRSVGSGAAALTYLAPYIFHVALSNKRLVSFVDERVTFGYIDGTSHQPKRCTLPVLTFLHRFVQHVLPRGFVKVRQFGLFSRRYRAVLAQLHAQLALRAASSPPQETSEPTTAPARLPGMVVDRCPKCGQVMRCQPLAPQRSRGPPARQTSAWPLNCMAGRIQDASLAACALQQGRDPQRAEEPVQDVLS